MKTRLSFFVSLCMIFLYGCVKEDITTVSPVASRPTLANASSFQGMNMGTIGPSVRTMSPNDIMLLSSEGVQTRTSQNASANGHFSPLEGWVSTFSGVQNNGGIHGNILITGPPAGFMAAVDCLTFDGDVVVVGGVITQVLYQQDFFIYLYPGLYVAFKVRDNGEGQNAPPDQVGTYIWFWDESPCQYLPPSNEELWGPMLDVLGQGDQIQVK